MFTRDLLIQLLVGHTSLHKYHLTSSLATSKVRATSLQRTKVLSPVCPLFRIHCSYMVDVYVIVTL